VASWVKPVALQLGFHATRQQVTDAINAVYGTSLEGSQQGLVPLSLRGYA
jgi:hypothetical protein